MVGGLEHLEGVELGGREKVVSVLGPPAAVAEPVATKNTVIEGEAAHKYPASWP